MSKLFICQIYLYEHKFALGSDINENKIEATYKHGILELKKFQKRNKIKLQ